MALLPGCTKAMPATVAYTSGHSMNPPALPPHHPIPEASCHRLGCSFLTHDLRIWDPPATAFHQGCPPLGHLPTLMCMGGRSRCMTPIYLATTIRIHSHRLMQMRMACSLKMADHMSQGLVVKLILVSTIALHLALGLAQ